MAVRCESCGVYSGELDKDTGIEGADGLDADTKFGLGFDGDGDDDRRDNDDADDDPDDGGDHWDDGDYD